MPSNHGSGSAWDREMSKYQKKLDEMKENNRRKLDAERRQFHDPHSYKVYGVDLLNKPSDGERRSEIRYESPRSDPPCREVALPPYDGRRSGEEIQFHPYDGSRDYKVLPSEPLNGEQSTAAATFAPTSGRSLLWVPMEVKPQSGRMLSTVSTCNLEGRVPFGGRMGRLDPEQRYDAALMRTIGSCSNCKKGKEKCDPRTPCGTCVKHLLSPDKNAPETPPKPSPPTSKPAQSSSQLHPHSTKPQSPSQAQQKAPCARPPTTDPSQVHPSSSPQHLHRPSPVQPGSSHTTRNPPAHRSPMPSLARDLVDGSCSVARSSAAGRSTA